VSTPDIQPDNKEWDGLVKRYGNRAVTIAIFDAVLNTIQETLAAMNERNKARNAPLDALEAHVTKLHALESAGGDLAQRVQALEQKGYRGVWSPLQRYEVGAFVTDFGSLWHANLASQGIRPGTNSATWTLSVKRGKADAR